MKKWVLLLVCMMLAVCATALADVTIDETSFPDEHFREYIKTNFDKDGDGKLTDEEIAGITNITCNERSIRDMTGIELFTNLKSLICSENKLTELDLSQNKSLTDLYCNSNKLTKLNVNDNTRLVHLNCASNKLQQLDLSKNTNLTTLTCWENNLTALDVSRNQKLKELECNNNKIFNLNVSNNTAMTRLECSLNQLAELNLSQNTALIILGCTENQLKSLDLSNNAALQSVACGGNKLTELDVSRNTSLTALFFDGNQLTEINLSNNLKLEELNCTKNKLRKLDISMLDQLTRFECDDCNFGALDISGNTQLEYLSCRSNGLKELSLGQNPDLESLYCHWNKITKLDVSACAELCDIIQNNKRKSDDEWDWFGNYEVIVDRFTTVVAGDYMSEPTKEPKKSIEDAKLSKIKDQTYTGKRLTPKITVKYDGKKLSEGKDYEVSYKNNKSIGTATVTVTGLGEYEGSAETTFSILPEAVKLSSLGAGKKKITVEWEKGKKITGYKIEYSRKKNFKDSESLTVTKAKTTKTTIKDLKKGKTYYVRIRTYKESDGKKYYSKWSENMKVKIK